MGGKKVVKGEIDGQEGVPTRVHSECFTGDVLASKRCDCGQQLHKFMRVMNDVPMALLLYIKGQEGRGIGLLAKIRAYKLQDQGHDTVDANLKLGLPVDIRTYGDALFVLRDLGVKSVSLYTNNPDKMSALQSITKEVVAMPSVPCEQNMGYLKTKKDRPGLDLQMNTATPKIPWKLNHRTVLETFKLPELSLPPSQLRIGIVYAMWNQYFVDELRVAAEAELERCRVEILKMAVPGALELVSGARIMLRHHKPDAVIVIGVLIKGSSDLYDRSCNAVMTGLTELNAIQDTPVIVGLLMCQNEELGAATNRDLFRSGTRAGFWGVETSPMELALCRSVGCHGFLAFHRPGRWAWRKEAKLVPSANFGGGTTLCQVHRGNTPSWRHLRSRRFAKPGETGAPIIGFSNLITVLVILTMSCLQVLRREVAPLGTIGVIVANFLTKGLKLLIKRLGPESLWKRPAESTRDPLDPGFPSSHTSNMSFISVYFALYLWLHLGLPPQQSILVAVIPSFAMAAARIWDKDHTLQQTIGGVLWGASLGTWWALIGPRLRGILEWAQPQPWALVVLCFAVGLPMFTKPLGSDNDEGPKVLQNDQIDGSDIGTSEQASERSHGPNNPAKAWAQTSLHMASLARSYP
eukprot:symbB.v1.2.012035.t1/scaffold756.1/size166813/5